MGETPSTDIVAKLLADHEEVKAMFSRIDRAVDADRADLFCQLTSELVRHEVAEEEVVYPWARRSLPDGETVANNRIEEQAEVEELLVKLEKSDPSSPEFRVGLAILQKNVLAHAEAEERTVFVPLRKDLDSERLEQLGHRYDRAKKAAPTRPHPLAPDTPPGNLVLGPIVSLFDRARGAMHKVVSGS